MENFSYSVVIRTLGLAGEKYRRMLNAIERQTVKPKEILVVLAEGYKLPPEQLGYERFVFSKKGIVTQRSFGAKQAIGDYCLFLDDDLDFEDNLVEKLYEPIRTGIADVTFPLLTEMLPQKGFRTLLPLLTISAVPMVFNKEKSYTRILKSGGWSYNRNVDEENVNYYRAESAPGACYLVKREHAVKIRFEEERWLELTSFSLPDDQINFYKYHVLGYKIYGVSHVAIEHLDGGGNSPERALKATYSLAKHKIIFWHRFIYKNDPILMSQIISVICFMYWLVSSTILKCITDCLLKHNVVLFKTFLKGVRDGFAYLKTSEYKLLPIVKQVNYK